MTLVRQALVGRLGFFLAAQNNGKIQSESASGETVSYQYDSRNRLSNTSNSSTWGQGFTYDGFWNLMAKTVSLGSAPRWSAAVDPATNRLATMSYDANGNAAGFTYDVENRITQVVTGDSQWTAYGYDADNRQVYKAAWRMVIDGQGDRVAQPGPEELTFWGVDGKRIGTYSFAPYTGVQ